MKFLFLIFLISCTTIHYKNSGIIDVSMSYREGMNDHLVICGRREFYLWGIYPKAHDVYIDKEFKDRGFRSATKIKISEYQTGTDYLLSFLSFGMYIPKNYVLEGYGLLETSE